MEYDKLFWEYLEEIVNSNEIVIDRPKGSKHPKRSDVIFEFDYGYIENTKSMDGGGIDVFIGSQNNKKIDAIICTIDLFKKDSEIKILIGCSEEDKIKIYNFMNRFEFSKAIMVKR